MSLEVLLFIGVLAAVASAWIVGEILVRKVRRRTRECLEEILELLSKDSPPPVSDTSLKSS